MELLLISPLGLDYSPDLVASKFCQHPLLQTAPREFFVSSDCLAFASAFQSQLKCIYSVNYDWDEQHTPAKPEPERHKVFHPTDWTVEETYEQFVERVWKEAHSLKLRMRVVLCTSAVIRVISRLDGLSMCHRSWWTRNDTPWMSWWTKKTSPLPLVAVVRMCAWRLS